MAKPLSPPPKFTVYYNGLPSSGAKVYTYAAGTSTPIDTYSNDGGTLNANPVICDSRGECDIRLTAGTAYKFVVKTSADVTIYTVDNILGVGNSTFEGDVDMSNATSVDYLDGSIEISDLNEDLLNLILSSGGVGGVGGIISGDGRLSLATGIKTMTSDYAAQGTVYYVGGVILNFNDGAGTFQPFNTGELSQTLASSTYSPAAGAASKIYDMFAWKRTISVTGLSRSATTVTATTSASHNITTGAIVYIEGASPTDYNGYHTLTGGSGTSFTFEITGSPATPATGTITAKTATLSRGPFWTSDTARGTGAGTTQLTLVGSTYTNTVDITNGPAAGMGTYLGSIITDTGGATVTWKLGTAAASGGEAWLGVWNVSNRVLVGTAVQDTTSSWTVTATGLTIGTLNASLTWRSTFIAGLNDSVTQAQILSQVFPPAVGAAGGVGVAVDSTTVLAPRANVSSSGGSSSSNNNYSVTSQWNGYLGLGKHYIQAMQITNQSSGTCTFYGLFSSGVYQSSMYTYSYQ